MNNKLIDLAEFLKKEDNYIVCGHVNPDGDVIGSAFAMYLILKQLGKNVIVSFDPSYVPKKYRFLQFDKIIDAKEIAKFEKESLKKKNLIILECPSIGRLGALESVSKEVNSVVNIDHHLENDGYGKINIIFSEASATTEIIYYLAPLLDIDISRDIATCIYVGILTDTGRFQYSNTDRRTHIITADLLEKGVEPNTVFQNIYESVSYPSLKLVADIISKSQIVCDGKVIWSVIERKDIKKGADIGDIENLIDYLRSVKGPEVSVLIKKDNNDKKISLRSRGNIDVAAIASSRGGGGHAAAAGFSTTDDVDDIIKWISEQTCDNISRSSV